jgi:hypothetical protein
MEDVANPARLIEFLRNNEAVDFSGYQGDWHRHIGQWTADGLERAAAAARSNTSLATLRVNVAIVADEDEVDRISAFLENFRCVSHLEITNEFDDDDNAFRGGGRGANDVGEPRAVDKILLGMCRSESDLVELTLTCSGGWAAIAEFAKRFPGVSRLGLVGGPRGGPELMRLSNDFSHGLAAAIGTQWRHHLSHLRHHVTGELRDVARVTAAVGACPRLAEWDVSLDPTHRDYSALATRVCTAGAASESLRKLHLRILHNREGDPAGPDRAFFEFPRPLSPSLKAVCLHGVRFPASNASRPAPRVLKHITALELHACDLVAGAASLLHVLGTMPQLESLVVASRAGVPSFDAAGIVLFARWIPSHQALNSVTISVGPGRGLTNESDVPAIELLLRNCRGTLHLTCHDLGAWAFADLCRGLESAQLTTLSLRLCRLRIGQNVDVVRFLAIVGPNRTLEELSLQLSSRGARGDDLARALAEMLRSNRTLRRLKLTNVAGNLVGEVYNGIVAGLAENRSIEHVGVASRNGAEGVVPAACLPDLVPVLRTNVTIRELDGLSLLPPNDHPLAGDAAFLLKQNRFGRSLLWTDPPQAPIGLWARAFANISEAGASDVMYRFLRTKLDLVGQHRRRTVAGRVEY